MNTKEATKANSTLPVEVTAQIEHWISKFPQQQQRSAIIAALAIVQQTNNGWLSEKLLSSVADYFLVPLVEIYEIASFYSIFQLNPPSEYTIEVCNNVPCMLAGSKDILNHLNHKINVELDQADKEGKIIVKEIECVADCDKGPVMKINQQLCCNVTIEQVDKILATLNF